MIFYHSVSASELLPFLNLAVMNNIITRLLNITTHEGYKRIAINNLHRLVSISNSVKLTHC